MTQILKCSILPGDAFYNTEERNCGTPLIDHEELMEKYNGIHRITQIDGKWHVHQGELSISKL